MSLLSGRLRRYIRESALGPVLSDARAIAAPHVRRLQQHAKARGNDVAIGLSRPARFDEDLPTQWSRILETSDPIDLVAPPLAAGRARTRVMFATAFGFSPVKLAFESILGAALRLRGAEVVALSCEKTLSACEFNSLGNFKPSPGEYGPTHLGRRAQLATCQRCRDEITEIWEPLRVPIVGLHSFSKEGDVERLEEIARTVSWESPRTFMYKDVHVGDHAFSSVLRATLRGTLQDDARTRWLFHRYVVAAMHLVDLAERLFAVDRPDRLIAVHGVYVTHGTLCEVARKHGIPVVVFGIPYRQGTVMLSHDDTYHRTLVSEPTSLWEDRALTTEEAAELDRYVESKRGGGRDYFNYHPRALEDRRQILEDLRLDPARPIISLFTNVLWDAQIYYNHNAFDNMLVWLFATIEHLGKRPDVQLAIRVHPAEVKGGMPTSQPIMPEIERRFPRLPDNVRVIAPESDISSYTLAEMSRAALIYGTKMGLEIALRGIPVVVCGETFSRGKGFTHDMTTAHQYAELLDRVEHLPRYAADKIERARRYAHYFYFRRMIDFPLFSVADAHRSTTLKLRFDALSALRPGQHRALDIVCDGVLEKKPFEYEH